MPRSKKDEIDAFLAAVANPTRRKILELLEENSPSPSDLAEALGISRPLVSRHLAVLRDAGVIIEGRDQEDFRSSVLQLERSAFTALRVWAQRLELKGRYEGASARRRSRSG